MAKYALYIDYKASASYWYSIMNAKNLEEAIEEADANWSDDIYLMRIMKKVGTVKKCEDHKIETYEAILCRRSSGWHRNIEKNGENEHIAERCIGRNFDWFEIV